MSIRGIGVVSEAELRRANGSPVKQSRVTARLIAAGLMYYRRTGNRYSPTAAGMRYIKRMDAERGQWVKP